MYSQLETMQSTITVEDLACLSWSMIIAKHENEYLRHLCKDKESLDHAILQDEYDIFCGAEEIIQKVWANARIPGDPKWLA